MSEQAVPIIRQSGVRFVRVVKSFLNSEVRWHALGLFAVLFGLLFAVNGLNVVNSYVGRDFMTAISGPVRQAPQLLTPNSVTPFHLAGAAQPVEPYDAVPDIDGDGAWAWRWTDAEPMQDRGDEETSIPQIPIASDRLARIGTRWDGS